MKSPHLSLKVNTTLNYVPINNIRAKVVHEARSFSKEKIFIILIKTVELFEELDVKRFVEIGALNESVTKLIIIYSTLVFEN